MACARDPEPIGDEFITNPLVNKLAFTGSTEVGKLLARGAAEHMKRISLELGGHAPFIVFDDADPRRAAILLIGFAVPEEEVLRGTLAGAAFPFCIGMAYMILHFFSNRED